MTSQDALKTQVSQLPHSPGVYKFFDASQTLLYVGKAKDLRNRVGSYFNQSAQHSRKTLRMVKQIIRLEVVLVNNEYDALLLENNLIKQHQPKYNILLKDDKTYPYICITNEDFPKIEVLRQVDRRYGTFFGPYTHGRAMSAALDLIRELYPVRNCSLALTPHNIAANKFKVCLEYHLGNCKGPCEGLQSVEAYGQDIQEIKQILKGNASAVVQSLKVKMMAYAEALAFEKAQELKEKITLLENFRSKSLVVNPNIADVDVFSISTEEKGAFVNYLKIKQGAIVHTQNLELQKRLEESDEELLTFAVLHLRAQIESQAPEVLTNIALSTPLEGVVCHVPKIGDKRKLIDLSLKNALFAKKEKLQKAEAFRKKRAESGVLNELQKALSLPVLPDIIECFDNSNIQGTNPVASMVQFKNGKPHKKEYRHFHIKTVEGPNDFASMYEIVYRRYSRIIKEKQALPDLIVIDGGKGQLSSACQALKDLHIYGRVSIIGIAKRLEEIYFPEDEIPLHLSKKSAALKVLQHARDEAHRFAITFHRDVRSKNSLNTQLETLPGIGEATIQKLLKTYKSLTNIAKAPEEELAKLIGQAKAKVVYGYFRESSQSTKQNNSQDTEKP
jgi:excinuclease ABC subunit C